MVSIIRVIVNDTYSEMFMSYVIKKNIAGNQLCVWNISNLCGHHIEIAVKHKINYFYRHESNADEYGIHRIEIRWRNIEQSHNTNILDMKM